MHIEYSRGERRRVGRQMGAFGWARRTFGTHRTRGQVGGLGPRACPPARPRARALAPTPALALDAGLNGKCNGQAMAAYKSGAMAVEEDLCH